MKKWQLYVVIFGGLIVGLYFGSGVGNISLPNFLSRFLQISSGLFIGFFVGYLFTRIFKKRK